MKPYGKGEAYHNRKDPDKPWDYPEDDYKHRRREKHLVNRTLKKKERNKNKVSDLDEDQF
jgi:hypothetical protein